MITEHFVGRKNAVKQLQSVLTGDKKSGGNLAIQSIEGPGGIGKTCLFDHAADGVDLTSRNYLTLRIDGNSLSTDAVEQAVVGLIDSAKANAIRNHMPRYYFPTVQRVVKEIEVIRSEAAVELKKKHENENATEDLQQFLDWVFSAGKKVNDAFPSSKKHINFQEVKKLQPLVEEAIPLMKSLQDESPRFWERLGLGDSTALRNAIKKNACAALSRALLSDLVTILSGYQKKDTFKATHPKIKGIDRFLLILDDYEKLQNSIGVLLVGHLLSGLKSAEFESVVIILGRDQLEATDPAWDQHLKKHLLPRIVLTPLSQPEMNELVESYGVQESDEKERVWRDTQGYPFYVQLWTDELSSGGRSAIMLKRFHDRTTRWMNDQQKKWLQHILFLDEINIRTLQRMLDDEHEAFEVFNWFQHEGSIRDTSGSAFRVREYLRSRLIDYMQISDPDRCDQLQRKGKVALNAQG
ncbi:hypothetical protein [Halomonas heilongjiangensis]|uniref:hypothetical protein n=1 Tax=Halomonas heilongjiangensis TaxID=1387883 RepID=UPI0011AEE2F7|nr:hypothetical protein [Halomonas heilongjiangensis]